MIPKLQILHTMNQFIYILVIKLSRHLIWCVTKAERCYNSGVFYNQVMMNHCWRGSLGVPSSHLTHLIIVGTISINIEKMETLVNVTWPSLKTMHVALETTTIEGNIMKANQKIYFKIHINDR